jgi:hypothetical protein
MVDPGAAFHEVARLLHDTWWRLPVAVRPVVASRLNGVWLGYAEGGLSEGYANGDLQLSLGKDGVSGAGRANVVRALLWGCGMAFLEALYVQTPGEAEQLAAAAGRPWDERWGRSMQVVPLFQFCEKHGPDLRDMVSEMASALGRAWGFDEAYVRSGREAAPGATPSAPPGVISR